MESIIFTRQSGRVILRGATAALLILLPLTVQAADLYVSPRGSDANPGTRSAPLQTIAAAQAVARTLPAEPVVVYLAGGTHYLSQPVVFTTADARLDHAPLVITAQPGQEATVSGGRCLALAWRPFRGAIHQASVDDTPDFDQLFLDGRRQQMARWPDYDPQAQYFQGFSPDCTAPQRVLRWRDPAGAFLHAMHRNLWGDMHWLVTGKTDSGTLELVGGWQNNRQMGAHDQFRFIENVWEELDAPGEWYLDRQARQLFCVAPPAVNLTRARVEVVVLPHLFELRGTADQPVRNVTLQGLTLTHTCRTFMDNKEPLLRSDWTTYRGGAVLLEGTRDCAIRDCTIDQVGGNAVFVSGYNRRLRITTCHIANAGASGVSFVGRPEALRSPLFEYHETQALDQIDKVPGPRSDVFPADCLVEDCLIYRNGRFEKQTAGVNICMAQSITVRHCSIYDCPRAGINICDGAFGGHVIEHCDVFDTVKETGDHGSFNSWGRDRFWHPDRQVTARWVKQYPDMPQWDCCRTITLRNNRWRCDHGWDIDLDDGSSNYEIYNNLCLAGGIKLREGYCRRVYNNILVDYTFCPHVWYPDCQTTFQRNIIWQERYAPAGMRVFDDSRAVDFNLVQQPGEPPRPAEQLRDLGGDRHSLVADAQFLNPAEGDYRVADSSPALQLGFQNFPMDQFGVRSPELKRIARTPPLPGTLSAARITSGGWGRQYRAPVAANWLGARVKNVETDGEMSAVGLGDKNGVLVTHVPAGTEAARVGLRDNDVVRAVGDQAVDNLQTLARLWEQPDKASTVVLELWRDQATVTHRIRRDP